MSGFIILPGTNTPLLSKLRQALEEHAKWSSLARFEISKKYTLTGLGPWWSVGSNIAFIVAIWSIYSGALKLSADYYFSHIFVGYLVWILVSQNISSSTNLFVSSNTLISQMRLNYFGIILKWLITRIYLFSYNIILLPAFLIFGQLDQIGWEALTVLPAIFLILINSFMLAYTLSLLTTGIRDVPYIVPIFIRFFFFTTPIIWDESGVANAVRVVMVDFNPFYYIIETIRYPLVEGGIFTLAWIIFGVITVLNWLVMAYLYRRYDHRIIYLSM